LSGELGRSLVICKIANPSVSSRTPGAERDQVLWVAVSVYYDPASKSKLTSEKTCSEAAHPSEGKKTKQTKHGVFQLTVTRFDAEALAVVNRSAQQNRGRSVRKRAGRSIQDADLKRSTVNCIRYYVPRHAILVCSVNRKKEKKHAFAIRISLGKVFPWSGWKLYEPKSPVAIC
jgi:hypothetical protein